MPLLNSKSSVQEQRQAIFRELMAYLSPRDQESVRLLAGKLVKMFEHDRNIDRRRIMVAYGGGKDSTYTVGFMRTVQLYVESMLGRTFILRIATMRQPGMPYSVMENIDRVYLRLGLIGDITAELIVIDHDQVSQFKRDLPMPPHTIEVSRLNMLMNGHRTAGDGRPTFCNSCNLSVASFYGISAWWRGGVDVVVTGDSLKEQKHYFTWIMRLAQNIGMNIEEFRALGFHGLLKVLDGVSQVYYQELFGSELETEVSLRHVHSGQADMIPTFVSIYEHVSYRVDDHWKFVTEFLGFQFDELAFSFTESDCANPALMAHLRGLKAQYVQGRSYHIGIEEYIELANGLMIKKEMPKNLIEIAISRYDNEAKICDMRHKINAFAEQAYGVNEQQLVCMVFSPFVDQGRSLLRFLQVYHPDHADHEKNIHSLLADNKQVPDSCLQLQLWLENISGLRLCEMRALYRNSLVDFESNDSLIAIVRLGDPHKKRIQTVDPVSGEEIMELISGR
ncbi:hypothetical protein [Methylobacter sp. BlB1]|jgi:hypothetical protein|uniref:hypothetical protein n=1 Tax=Methylobacter sp. BlB1 TaxID=2785914 RepID=UPI001893C752|nr:hypothetical protein [Methylobacter sp. BlB1]MBF6651101.1 hypothetical protein [Methylobacter sp. BlB1]